MQNIVFDTAHKAIAVGSDHAGFAYKHAVIEWLVSKGFQVNDMGTYDESSVDYPDFAHPTAEIVATEAAAFGILFCGSANGVAITANKHQKIRAGLCWENDVARLVRRHNNANIICIPARFVALSLAQEMIENFMTTEFEGGRHALRVNKVGC